MAGAAATAALQLISSTTYARLLTPDDFGLLTWATVTANFIFNFTNLGFNVSLIQREELDQTTMSTAWWSNMALDSTAALVCTIAAIVTSWLLPTAGVAPLLAMLALQFLITGLGTVNAALMLRRFMYRQMAMTSLVEVLITFLVAVSLLTATDLGVSSLLIGAVAGTTCTTVARFLCVPWLPSMAFSWDECRRQLKFGSALLGQTLVTYVGGSLDTILVGVLLDRTSLGYFGYASTIPSQVTSQLGTLLNRALFPALATLQNDRVEFRRVLLKYLQTTSLCVYPMLAGIALVADPFVRLAYGEAWLPIVVPMQIVSVTGMVGLIGGSLTMVCNAVGRPGFGMQATAIAFPFNAAGTGIAVAVGGLVGASCSRVLEPTMKIALLLRSLAPELRVSNRDLIAGVVPAVVGCASMAAACLLAQKVVSAFDLGPLVLLASTVGVAVPVYAITIWMGWPNEVRALLAMARRVVERASSDPGRV